MYYQQVLFTHKVFFQDVYEGTSEKEMQKCEFSVYFQHSCQHKINRLWYCQITHLEPLPLSVWVGTRFRVWRYVQYSGSIDLYETPPPSSTASVPFYVRSKINENWQFEAGRKLCKKAQIRLYRVGFCGSNKKVQTSGKRPLPNVFYTMPSLWHMSSLCSLPLVDWCAIYLINGNPLLTI